MKQKERSVQQQQQDERVLEISVTGSKNRILTVSLRMWNDRLLELIDCMEYNSNPYSEPLRKVFSIIIIILFAHIIWAILAIGHMILTRTLVDFVIDR